jgi:hypothetical protein
MTEEARVKVLCMELGLRVGVIGEGGLSLLVPCVLSQSVLCHLSLHILVASHISYCDSRSSRDKSNP